MGTVSRQTVGILTPFQNHTSSRQSSLSEPLSPNLPSRALSQSFSVFPTISSSEHVRVEDVSQNLLDQSDSCRILSRIASYSGLLDPSDFQQLTTLFQQFNHLPLAVANNALLKWVQSRIQSGYSDQSNEHINSLFRFFLSSISTISNHTIVSDQWQDAINQMVNFLLTGSDFPTYLNILVDIVHSATQDTIKKCTLTQIQRSLSTPTVVPDQLSVQGVYRINRTDIPRLGSGGVSIGMPGTVTAFFKRDASDRKNVFEFQQLMSILDHYFIRSGCYSNRHIPIPLGENESGIYMECIEGPEVGVQTCPEWEKAKAAFGQFGLDIGHDLYITAYGCDSDDGQISHNTISQRSFFPSDDHWFRIDFESVSFKANIETLQRAIRENWPQIESVLPPEESLFLKRYLTVSTPFALLIDCPELSAIRERGIAEVQQYQAAINRQKIPDL